MTGDAEAQEPGAGGRTARQGKARGVVAQNHHRRSHVNFRRVTVNFCRVADGQDACDWRRGARCRLLRARPPGVCVCVCVCVCVSVRVCVCACVRVFDARMYEHTSTHAPTQIRTNKEEGQPGATYTEMTDDFVAKVKKMRDEGDRYKGPPLEVPASPLAQ